MNKVISGTLVPLIRRLLVKNTISVTSSLDKHVLQVPAAFLYQVMLNAYRRVGSQIYMRKNPPD
jgi:hypothetical protein